MSTGPDLYVKGEMSMTNQDLVNSCDRALAGINEVKANAVRLAQLEQQVQAAESKLAAQNAKLEQRKSQEAQIEQLDQTIRAKRVELADVEAEVARKHKLHGDIESQLRDLRKRVSGDPTHA
jgi:predicted  nucleic acid-binding Zn-ribbon protein